MISIPAHSRTLRSVPAPRHVSAQGEPLHCTLIEGTVPMSVECSFWPVWGQYRGQERQGGVPMAQGGLSWSQLALVSAATWCPCWEVLPGTTILSSVSQGLHLAAVLHQVAIFQTKTANIAVTCLLRAQPLAAAPRSRLTPRATASRPTPHGLKPLGHPSAAGNALYTTHIINGQRFITCL